jgi:transcriptional activator SPT7
MNNLLRTLTESQVQATPDLKLLLNTVKDARRQGYDNKASEPFYDSLEGILHDLRTVTMDNHDAEAFLKPVAKSDVPDYYDVISNPMDLQSMLKKVKAKQYKSKREFNDDLGLIWSNCFTYNATEASSPTIVPLFY